MRGLMVLALARMKLAILWQREGSNPAACRTRHRDIKKKMNNLKIMFITNNNYEQKQSYV